MAGRGRPVANTEGIMLRLPRTSIAEIDELRRAEPDIPTRQEMIRRLIAEAIERRGKASG